MSSVADRDNDDPVVDQPNDDPVVDQPNDDPVVDQPNDDPVVDQPNGGPQHDSVAHDPTTAIGVSPNSKREKLKVHLFFSITRFPALSLNRRFTARFRRAPPAPSHQESRAGRRRCGGGGAVPVRAASPRRKYRTGPSHHQRAG
jgi:hypothetical protein